MRFTGGVQVETASPRVGPISRGRCGGHSPGRVDDDIPWRPPPGQVEERIHSGEGNPLQTT